MRCRAIESPHAELYPAAPDGSLNLLTPFDALFLIIAFLSALPPHFLPYSDLWESVSLLSFTSPLTQPDDEQPPEQSEDEDRSMGEDILRFGQMECVRRRLEQICETKGERQCGWYEAPRCCCGAEGDGGSRADGLGG
jgi:hypothetical protein